jgi:hypothetical protein
MSQPTSNDRRTARPSRWAAFLAGLLRSLGAFCV